MKQVDYILPARFAPYLCDARTDLLSDDDMTAINQFWEDKELCYTVDWSHVYASETNSIDGKAGDVINFTFLIN